MNRENKTKCKKQNDYKYSYKELNEIEKIVKDARNEKIIKNDLEMIKKNEKDFEKKNRYNEKLMQKLTKLFNTNNNEKNNG